ncbi:hypothetical protein NQ314_019219 [Rhamnusium bicolor]|uniref:DUF4806 domain-containing protein n=1 Tax=Rhamnusium bicolor TaxID=1586634 RepID=A0AAV8WP21_9CUCU|nr:hypothetical protein NQ314_019219 [Rhamnusium bicolor]
MDHRLLSLFQASSRVYMFCASIAMYNIVEFCNEAGGGLAIVHTNWLTPRKQEVFWPPYKDNSLFTKALKTGERTNEKWKLYEIVRNFYKTDDLEKAKRKLKLAEDTSDLNTETDENEFQPRKRLRKPTKISSSEDEEENSNFQRPPKLNIKKKLESNLSSSQKAGNPSISSLPSTLGVLPKIGTHVNSPQTASPNTPTTSRNWPTPSESVTIPKSEYDNIIRLLAHIKEQNKEILNIITERGRETSTALTSICLPNNFPIELPASTDDDVQAVEDFLKTKENINSFCSYLSTLGGGKSYILRTNKVLRQLLTDSLACKYSFFGSRKDKKAFSELLLKKVVINAIQIKSPDTTETEIEDSVKTWLKHAPQRMNSCDSSPYNQENKKVIMNDLSSKLKDWATIENRVSQVALTSLLHILSPFHPELPLDSRTLLKTPKYIETKKLETGEYYHFGLLDILKNLLLKHDFTETILQLSVNIDGLPLFHSTNTQLWPILGLIKNSDIKSKPFAIGIFCGTSKPVPLNLYLEDFINEVNLLKQGFQVNNRVYYIRLLNFICDAPARAFLKCVKSHGGYSSCDKCWEPGNYYKGRVILKGITSTLRTDTSFLLQQDEDHHISTSPLIDTEIGMVSAFPLDYMHAVCLGVTRKLLNVWVGGNLKVRLRSRTVDILSKHLISLKPFIPIEFNRKPRSLSELPRWKATEFRTFLLYVGPLILKNNIDLAVYEHFLLLHCGISLLLSFKYISDYGCEHATELLNIFVKHCEHIYGLEFYAYNVHILCHLTRDVEMYGPLDMFSAFPFENYLGQIKHLLKSSYKPLKQICRRLKESNFDIKIVSHEGIKHYFEHNSGQTLTNEK